MWPSLCWFSDAGCTDGSGRAEADGVKTPGQMHEHLVGEGAEEAYVAKLRDAHRQTADFRRSIGIRPQAQNLMDKADAKIAAKSLLF